MHLLHRLPWRVFLTPSNSMIEYDHLLHTRMRLLQKLFYFLVVAIPHCRVIDEELLLGWLLVYSESGVVR